MGTVGRHRQARTEQVRGAYVLSAAQTACCTAPAPRGARRRLRLRLCLPLDAFHVPHISLPFISAPPLCRFEGGVQSASRISLQLVLVQIQILKKKKRGGGLNQACLSKDQ